MQVFLPFMDLRQGDYFVDPYAGFIGHVKAVSVPKGAPACVEIDFVDLTDGREMQGSYNALHVTKYLRPGETDVRMNLGRG